MGSSRPKLTPMASDSRILRDAILQGITQALDGPQEMRLVTGEPAPGRQYRNGEVISAADLPGRIMHPGETVTFETTYEIAAEARPGKPAEFTRARTGSDEQAARRATAKRYPRWRAWLRRLRRGWPDRFH